ncbi:NADH dehydrogenase [ubiquinone] 1 alpha subcomplex subunit 11-like [Epargyreus clarus]|uniref:NADH dehydrogenase [ubiquinone] 1 alpha subcomplex subunit 11-like n=1 Tax=Epargyreus clarus TaxID=520877 RepID=UPI003C2D188E
MSCECKEKKRRNYYRYYDTPDGCDVSKKTMVTARYGAIAGLVAGTFDVLLYSHATELGHIMRRYAFHMGHPALMGATFALAANAAQHAREKDDSLNYFLGGLACGPILASYLGSKHAILLGGIFLGVIGMIKKDAIDNYWTLFPTFPSHMGTINSWRNDFTLAKDPQDEMQHTCGKKVC